LAPAPAPTPVNDGDARQRLHAHLMEAGMTHLADAVENATIAIAGGELVVAAPKSYSLYFKDKVFEQATREVFGRTLRVKLTVADSAAPQPALAGPRPVESAAKTDEEDETTTRALADPEVQRFREVLGGEVRRVRNLKE
jgi:hypothetical protein